MGSYTYGSIDVIFSRRLNDDEFKTYNDKIQQRCSECWDTTDEWSWPRPYQPEWWVFDQAGDTGDAGGIDICETSFTVAVGGKVYDLEMALKHFIHALPPDVQCDAEGYFETEGEDWGIRVKRREVQTCNVELVMEPWKEEPLQTAAYAALELMEGGNL